MSNVNAEIKWQGNDDAWFTANASTIYDANIQIFHIDGRYKFTDGVTTLGALPFLGSGGGSQDLQSVTDNGNTTTNAINATQFGNGDFAKMDVSDGISMNFVASDGVTFNTPFADFNGSLTKSGVEVATVNDLSDYLLKADKATKASNVTGTNDTTYVTPLSGTAYATVVYKDLTQSSILTGTTAITLVKSCLIPANTFQADDECEIKARFEKNNATGTSVQYLYYNTSNTLSGATLMATQSSVARFFGILRVLNITASNSCNTLAAATSASTDTGVFPSSKQVLSIDWTQDVYIIQAFALANSADTGVSLGLTILRHR